MKMKLAVAGLCLMGLIAAGCAALLVNALRASASMRQSDVSTDSADVEVLFATRSLPPMTVVDASVLAVKTMHKTDAPKKYMSRPADAVGKVLAVPVSQGQALTTGVFAEEGGARQFAAIIPAGKRAIGVPVADFSGLIYPGSCVDVLVSFKGQEGDWHNAVTKTLMENVQVLAIDDQTLVSPGKTVTQALSNSDALKGTKRFTLLVDTLQAKTLSMAQQQGTLSLTLRNPMDDKIGDADAVSVRSLVGDPKPDPFAVVAPAPQAPPTAAAPKPADPTWDMTIIRGTDVNTESFPMPAGKLAGSIAADKPQPKSSKPTTRPAK